MKFSIVITLYNKGRYIAGTIESALAQTFTDFEIIVVDDGSTDDGPAIVESFPDPRLRLLKQANAGVSAARNRGIDKARGEWVAFLDADDWQHPAYLETLVKVQQRFPHADTVATDFISVPDSSERWPPEWPALPADPEMELIEDLAGRWMSGQLLYTSSTAVRTARLKAMQPCFPRGEFYGEDHDLWFRLSEQAPVAVARVPLSAYRTGVEGSLTSLQPKRSIPPFIVRMQVRARSGEMDAARARSTLWLAAQLEISLARQALDLGGRIECLRWLYRARYAASGKRWWMTAAMACFFPRSFAKSWQLWRVRRRTIAHAPEIETTGAAAAPQVPAALPQGCRVSIIIKALNEEKRITTTIESALNAISTVGAGEIILADSCSTDRTVELARRFPIRIVQLLNPEERCCGIGPQLGYQHSRGDFVYILDGDMEMKSGFLEQALAFMEAHPDVAGVAGNVVEQNTHSLEYISRRERSSEHMRPGAVDRLDLGALYRRSAIETAGYFSDRNLHSYEEFDLAVRLRALGWRLWRLPVDAANHWGHDAPPYRLLMRRWRNGYLWGLGELVRAAAGERRLRMVLRGVRELRLYLAVLAWWVVLASVPLWPAPAAFRLACMALLLAAPVLLMTWRKRSIKKAVYAVVSWCFNSAGLVRGLLREQRPPREAIASRVIREPSAGQAQAAAS